MQKFLEIRINILITMREDALLIIKEKSNKKEESTRKIFLK